MKELLLKSAQILNANIMLVLLVGICAVPVFSGAIDNRYFFLGIIVSFVLSIIIYSRVVTQIQGGTSMLALEILKANWLNYILVIFFLGLPLISYVQLSKLSPTSIALSICGKESVSSLLPIMGVVNVVTTYLSFLAFTAASLVLISSSQERKSNEA